MFSLYVLWISEMGFKSKMKHLGAFAKLRKATINLVSVRPTTIFREIWYWSIFRKTAETLQVSLKSDKSNGYFTGRPICICDHFSLSSS